jgi:hypothetical protein
MNNYHRFPEINRTRFAWLNPKRRPEESWFAGFTQTRVEIEPTENILLSAFLTFSLRHILFKQQSSCATDPQAVVESCLFHIISGDTPLSILVQHGRYGLNG